MFNNLLYILKTNYQIVFIIRDNLQSQIERITFKASTKWNVNKYLPIDPLSFAPFFFENTCSQAGGRLVFLLLRYGHQCTFVLHIFNRRNAIVLDYIESER